MGKTISVEDQDAMNITPGKNHVFNNIPYINDCMDSVRDGDPIKIELGTASYIGEAHTQTCLEHILLDVINTGNAQKESYRSAEQINPIVFERLSEPGLNIDDDLCTEYDENTREYNYGSFTTCVPRSIEAYAALRQYARPISNPDGTARNSKGSPFADESFKKVVTQMRSITRRYPHRLNSRCKIRRSKDMVSCLDAIIGQGNNWRVIDLNTVPTEVFSDSECMSDIKGGGFPIPCYEFIANQALRNNGTLHTTTTAYANTLLAKLLSMERFDKDLLYTPDMCVRGGHASCFDYILNETGVNNASPYAAINSVVARFLNKDGDIDTESAGSMFSGEKCTYLEKPYNCFDLLLRDTIGAPGGAIRAKGYISDSDAFYRLKKLTNNPRNIRNLWGLLEILEDVAEDGGGDIYDGMMSAIGFVHNPNGYTPGSLYKAFEESSTISGANGANDNGRSVIDHIISKPFLLGALIASQDNPSSDASSSEILMILNREVCTDKFGTTQNCISKLFDNWLAASDEVRDSYESSIRHVLEFYENCCDKCNLEMVKAIVPPEYVGLYTGSVVKTRDAGATVPIGDLLLSKIDDALTGNITTNPNHRSISSLIFGHSPAHFNLLKLDSVVSNIGIARTTSDYTKHLFSLVDGDELSVGDLSELIGATRVLFEPFAIRGAIPLLRVCYDMENEEMQNIIKLRLKPSLPDVGSGEQSFRYKTDTYMHKHFREDPRYQKPCSGLPQITDAVIEFYNEINRGARIPTSDKSEDPEFVYEPTKENLTKYSTSVMRDLNDGNPYSGPNEFVEEYISDVGLSETMRPDAFGIVGSYEVMDKGGRPSDASLYAYGFALDRLLLGGGVLENPYFGVDRDGKQIRKEVPHRGLISVFPEILTSESVGQRKDNRTATPQITFYENGCGVNVRLTYRDDQSGMDIEEMTKTFPFKEILTKLPKKILKSFQEKHPILFGLVQLVTAYEISLSKNNGVSYTLNISNRPIDYMRLSTGQHWDLRSCMRFGESKHLDRNPSTDNNIAVRGYLDFRSYIAFLTKKSPYEPKWFARMQMHRCKGRGGDELLSVQHDSTYYDVGGNYHPYSELLSDALNIILSDKRVNDKCSGRCTHYWANQKTTDGSYYKDYTDNEGGCRKYEPGTPFYKGILTSRTNQDADSSIFVKKISDTF